MASNRLFRKQPIKLSKKVTYASKAPPVKTHWFTGVSIGTAIVSSVVAGFYLSRPGAFPLRPFHAKSSDSGKLQSMLSFQEACKKLRRNEESYFVPRGKGVVRYDIVQVASNDPIEDDHAEQIVEDVCKADWSFWGVMDGHGGWTTSKKLSTSLIPFVARELSKSYQPNNNSQVVSSIKTAFRQLDEEICQKSIQKFLSKPSKTSAAEHLMQAISGSCALLAFYESAESKLRVACTGDSRALLGRRDAKGSWQAFQLSNDQTGSNAEEAERLQREHPGEEKTVVRNGRVLGNLEPTRAYGDARYKWTKKMQAAVLSVFEGAGRRVHPNLYTPPYVTAEPVVTTTDIQDGDFLVLATDGLWELLSNQEVADLVGRWKDDAEGRRRASSSWVKDWVTSSTSEKPFGRDTGQKAPRFQAKRNFVYEDANAATHLVRNALGGGDRDALCALLSIPAPLSRSYRDDLTVTVVFFGKGKQTSTGGIVINKEATNGAREAVHAKL